MFEKFFMLILCALNLQNGQRCRLNSRAHFMQPLPVILRNGRLLEPGEASGTVDLAHGETITLSCENGGYIVHPNAQRQEVVATVTCEAHDTFRNDEWLNAPATFSRFQCLYPPSYTARRTNQTCYRNHSVYEVGYQIQNNFHPLYETCFDDDNLTPIYSKYTQKSYNANYQTRVERPFFISEDIYGSIPVNDLFRPTGLIGAIASHVGSAVDKYVTHEQMLSRGHLAAKTDFVFAFGQRATFHYVNCAPQWTGFNGGNWNTLEVDLRNHINSVGYDTVIYTGTFGVSQLADLYGRKVNLHLYTDINNNPVIPVPLYFYKVVYSPSTKYGTAFVGINNPHLGAEEARSLFLCEDQCRGNPAFRWLSWHPDNPKEGYTFCCTIQDFRNAVPHLPMFEVTGIFP